MFTVSFYRTPAGEVRGSQYTHENITAGIMAIRALLPSSGPISPLDTIISAHSLSSGYGRAVAYTALFEGANFATVSSTKIHGTEAGAYIWVLFSISSLMLNVTEIPLDLSDLKSVERLPIPSATVLFVRPPHLTALTKAIVDKAKQNSGFFYAIAWRHKLAGLLEGFFTKQSLWDRLVFDNARMDIMGKGAGTVRAVIVSGGQ